MIQGYLMTKKCPRCGKSYIIPEKHFSKNNLNKDGLASICKNCRSEEHIFYKSLKPSNLKVLNCKFENCKKIFTQEHVLQEYYCVSCRDKANKFKYGKQKYYDDKNFKRRFKAKKETEKATNKDKNWSSSEIELLFKLRFDKKSFREIAKEIGRTSSACWKKYYNESKKRGIPIVNLSKEKYYDK